MSRKPKVTILYEDARGQRNEFGLHRLVISAVRDDDAITAPYHELAAALEHRCQKASTRYCGPAAKICPTSPAMDAKWR